MQVYFDNTATTPLAQEVKDAMKDLISSDFGNPSSIHSYGRKTKVLVENARKNIAKHLETSSSMLFFTSCGTEANNTVIFGSIFNLGCKRAITSPIEHHAVLHTLEHYQKNGNITLDFVRLDSQGRIDMYHLEQLLKTTSGDPVFVSLMHANNEISNLLPLKEVSRLCKKHKAYFHSDMVQTIGRYPIDLKELGPDFVSSSAHKFHGPKGVGFMYINNETVRIQPILHGGGQEMNMRGGTENIYGIIGMSKAIEIAYSNLERDRQHIFGLKTYMIDHLRQILPGVDFLGESGDEGLYTILNVLFPINSVNEMLLMNLDIKGIAASGGSACASGASHRSHVLEALHVPTNRYAVRFSFSKYNTKEEVDYCISVLEEIVASEK